MTSLYVDDFKLGLDTRRSILTAEPGSLRELDNCIITPGGEIQKRAAFVQVATLPAGMTQGLVGTNTGADGTEQLWTFRLGTPGAVTQVASFTLANGTTVPVMAQQLQTFGGTEQLTRVAAVDEYGPQQFFVCGYTAGTPGGLPGVTSRNWWLGNFVPDYVGQAPLVTGQKLYRLQGSVLYFGGVGDPSVTDPLNPEGDGPNTVNPGAGFIDLSLIDSDANWLIGMEAYYKQVAIFSRRVCLLYVFDPDPALNQLAQVLRIGAVSNSSVIQFGTGDVVFLSDSGIRSLRALNASLVAGVSDIGSPLDNIIQAVLAANLPAALVSEGVVDPLTGRYWLSIGNTIYVLSYWQSAKINAWSTFTLPFNVDHMTVAGTAIYLRSGDAIYRYGGYSGADYDTTRATVRTPHMAADTPTTTKKCVSINAMVSGNWAMSVGMSVNDVDFYELAANISGPTYAMQRIPFAGSGTHIGFVMTTDDAAPSMLGALAVQFQKTIET